MSVLRLDTEFHCEETLGVFGCGSDQSCDPHPEKCAGTACNQRCRNADDVTGSDGCGKSGTKCSKAGNLTVFARLFVGKHMLDSVRKLGNLKKFQTDGQENSCCQN